MPASAHREALRSPDATRVDSANKLSKTTSRRSAGPVLLQAGTQRRAQRVDRASALARSTSASHATNRPAQALLLATHATPEPPPYSTQLTHPPFCAVAQTTARMRLICRDESRAGFACMSALTYENLSLVWREFPTAFTRVRSVRPTVATHRHTRDRPQEKRS